MSGPRPSRRARVACVALLGAWAASCSADVDGYHLASDPFGNAGGNGEGTGGEVGANGGEAGTSGSETGGRDSAGGETSTGGETILPSTGGTGGRNQMLRDAGTPDTSVGSGGAGGAETGGAGSGGDGAGGIIGTGGTGTGGIVGTGGTGTGGAGTGGTGTGGTGTGGTGTGGTGTGGAGTGGTGTGGTGTGGAGTGGTGTGGTGTGGTGTGGTGTGGAGTGGSGAGGPSGPFVISTTQALGGITAAAWRPEQNGFYLLEPANHRFWFLDVSTDPATVSTSRPLPSGTIAPHAFGANGTDVYTVINSSVYRVPQNTGNASASPVGALGDNPAASTVSGAYAGGFFFIGETGGAAHAFSEASGAMDSGATALNQIVGVATDGTSFSFNTRGASSIAVHRVTPGSYATTPTCTGGTNLTYGNESAPIDGNVVGWILHGSSSGPYTLTAAPLTGAGCGTQTVTSYGTAPNGTTAAGLFGGGVYALVIPAVAGGIGTVEIRKLSSGVTPLTLTGVFFGGFPRQIVMGAPNHAVVLTDAAPTLIAF